MREKIKNTALKLVRKHKTRDPFALANALDISIKFCDFNKLQGFYFICFRQTYFGISYNLPKVLQAVCCAHMIGHDQLHRHLADFQKDYDLFANTEKEYEANLMAAHILVPPDLLDQYYNCQMNIEQIAAKEHLHPELIRIKFADYDFLG
jgi:Zn-dependent peptidase ImmA (M78 family)